ncbi:outer membrane lipoprotein-sorting protein [Nitrosomonas sp. HPC101]|uniref:outer membrane lipoprotein-sorting protein n=1 Tax=Nitrosomonas sp. HPC101 TaxID=1658667 RepID=UPI00136FAFD1|nr:outer membrane lipoprotein-sorting protein [Nitrosomonas sp. HPC101]MXS85039.1 outer membrane lipoprotein-sorting protein [Nitrosomonas sp. HPC101]
MNLRPLWFALIVNFILLIQGQIALATSIEIEKAAVKTDITAESILERADEIRFPRESFQVDVVIRTTTPDHSEDMYRYQVLSKGNENSIIRIIEPASERGQTILMKGRDLWIFMPSVSQPIRLALSQRLTGQVANGDIARANFTGDYHPQLLRNESIDGEDFYVLELTGVDRSVTYQKVLLWVNQSSFRPFKAEFYSVSGRLLKTSHYENFNTILGEERPTRIIMEDALKSGEVSVLDYSDMKLRDLPDKIFTKDYLKRLE